MGALRRIFITIIIAAFYSGGPALAKPPKPLFAENSVISVTLEAPFKELIKISKRETPPFQGTLKLDAMDAGVLPISVEARGNTRRTKGICQFPPLKIRFSKKPKSGLFKGQKNLKLVTHCRDQDSYEQNLLIEHVAYRLFNRVTEQSLRVRLARIQYVDSESGSLIAQRYGFFIEDMDHAAKRQDMVEIDVDDINNSQLQNEASVRIALFQYMIGNVDWSLSQPAPGKNCCHNSKLMGPAPDTSQDIIAIPYDFDNSGLVDPPYALLPERLKLRDITKRLYRGRCSWTAELQSVIPVFRNEKASLIAELNEIPGLEEKRKEKAKSYLAGFFEILGDPGKVKSHVIDKCRQ